MISRVFSLLAARDTVRLYAASSLDVMRLGKRAAPNRHVNAAIAAADERNAPSGLPWWIARGTLAIASTLRIGTTHSHGCRAKFAVELGRAISVQADSTSGAKVGQDHRGAGTRDEARKVHDFQS